MRFWRLMIGTSTASGISDSPKARPLRRKDVMPSCSGTSAVSTGWGIISCVYRAAEWYHKDIELAAHDILQYLDRARSD